MVVSIVCYAAALSTGRLTIASNPVRRPVIGELRTSDPPARSAMVPTMARPSPLPSPEIAARSKRDVNLANTSAGMTGPSFVTISRPLALQTDCDWGVCLTVPQCVFDQVAAKDSKGIRINVRQHGLARQSEM